MRVVGYLLIGLAVFIYYEAFKGRQITDVDEDIRDLVKATLTMDFDKTQEVIKRAGSLSDNTAPVPDGGNSPEGFGVVGGSIGGKVLVEARRLGSGAVGYRLTGIGPAYYDCSGLIWRAMVNCGINVPRFSSYTFPLLVRNKIKVPYTEMARGDILQWPGHMAIVESSTSAYNALNPSKGILSSSLKGLESTLGTPTVYRLTS